MSSADREWLQCKGSEFRDLEKVDARLHKKLVGAYERARDAAQACDTDWRTAAHIIGLTPLHKVYKERGICQWASMTPGCGGTAHPRRRAR